MMFLPELLDKKLKKYRYKYIFFLMPYKPKKQIKNAEALKVIQKLKKQVKKYKLIPVGSIRREEKTHSDIDILLVLNKKASNIVLNKKASNIVLNNKASNIVLNKKASNIVLNGKNNKIPMVNISNKSITLIEGKNRHQKYIFTTNKKKYLIDVFICTKKELPFMLFHYTGSKRYNIRTRAYAKKKGLLLNQYGLFARNTARGHTSKTYNIKTERDLVRVLGVSYRKPTNRAN